MCISASMLTLAGCVDQMTMPEATDQAPTNRLQLAFNGETGVEILVDGSRLGDPNLAKRLRVDVEIDGSTFAGNMSNKTIQISPAHVQADSVLACSTCEIHVVYHDPFNLVPSSLASYEGVLADGDYTIKLYRDDDILVGSKTIAINHANYNTGNGTFLDEARDQIITFHLDQNLQQVSSPTVDVPHTRAGTHLSASITQPTASDTTIAVGQSLTVQGLASNGVGGTKRYAWDWNATGGNQETFDTEFNTSTSASHTFNSVGDYKIRLVARDGNDDTEVAPHGGHYAVSTIKTVHVVADTGDDAAAAGNTLPPSIENGDFVSVTISMENTGSTTWTSAGSYQLLISQGGQYWIPGQDALTASVSPDSTHVFAFDLGLDDPFRRGNTACYHSMDHSGDLFGEENGRIIYVSDPKGFGPTQMSMLDTGDAVEEVVNPLSWLTGARSVRPVRFGPGAARVEAGGGQLINYRYEHAVPRTIDTVFQIVIDPRQAEVLPPQIGLGGTALRWRVGSVKPGEYWIRVTGTVPAGSGVIGSFPVRVLPSRTATGVLGNVTIHYPAR